MVGMPVRVNDGQEGGVRVRVVDVKRSQRSLLGTNTPVAQKVSNPLPNSALGGSEQAGSAAQAGSVEQAESEVHEGIAVARKRWSRAPKLPELDFSSGGAASPKSYESSPTAGGGENESVTGNKQLDAGDSVPPKQEPRIVKTISYDQDEPVARESETYDLLGKASQRAGQPALSMTTASSIAASGSQAESKGERADHETKHPFVHTHPSLRRSSAAGSHRDTINALHEATRRESISPDSRAEQLRTYRVDIHAPTALSYHRLETDCMCLVLEAGGRILSDTQAGSYLYLGGFLYSLPGNEKNPLKSTERSAEHSSSLHEGRWLPDQAKDAIGNWGSESEKPPRGYIVVQPWSPSFAPSTEVSPAKMKHAAIETKSVMSPKAQDYGTAQASSSIPAPATEARQEYATTDTTEAPETPKGLIHTANEAVQSPEEAEHASISSLHAHSMRNDELLAIAHDTDSSSSLDFAARPGDAFRSSSEDQPISPMPRQVKRKLQLVQQLRATYEAQWQSAGEPASEPEDGRFENQVDYLYPSDAGDAQQDPVPNITPILEEADEQTPISDGGPKTHVEELSACAEQGEENDDTDTIPLSAFRPTPKPSYSAFHPYRVPPAVTPTLTPRPSRSHTQLAAGKASQSQAFDSPSVPETVETIEAYKQAQDAAASNAPTLQSTTTPPTLPERAYPTTLTAASSFSTTGSPTAIIDPFIKPTSSPASTKPTTSPSPNTRTTVSSPVPAQTKTSSPFLTPRSRLSALFSPLRHHKSHPTSGEQTTPTKDKAAQILGIDSSGQSRFSVVRDLKAGEDSEDEEEEEWESCVSEGDVGDRE